jgi:hypothetical protein
MHVMYIRFVHNMCIHSSVQIMIHDLKKHLLPPTGQESTRNRSRPKTHTWWCTDGWSPLKRKQENKRQTSEIDIHQYTTAVVYTVFTTAWIANCSFFNTLVLCMSHVCSIDVYTRLTPSSVVENFIAASSTLSMAGQASVERNSWKNNKEPEARQQDKKRKVRMLHLLIYEHGRERVNKNVFNTTLKTRMWLMVQWWVSKLHNETMIRRVVRWVENSG